MPDNNTDDTKAKKTFSLSETFVVMAMTAMTYVYAFSSQRAYLESFGIEDFFTSVAIEEIVRSAAWLLVFSFLVFQMMQWPTRAYVWFFQRLWVFRTGFVFLLFTFLAFRASGASWISMGALAASLATLGSELYFIWSFKRRTKGDFEQYFQYSAEIAANFADITLDGKLATLIGPRTWYLILITLLVPYPLGSIIGQLQGEQQREFLEYVDSNQRYLLVHEVAGVFVSVGYGGLENGVPLLNGTVKVLNADAISKLTLTERTFETRLLRDKPTAKPTIEEWYRNEFKPLFIAQNEQTVMD